MSRTITPQHAINELVLDNVELRYRPVWDGNAWQVDRTSVQIVCEVELTSTGNRVIKGTHILATNALSQQGKNALDTLYSHIEDAIETLYP